MSAASAIDCLEDLRIAALRGDVAAANVALATLYEHDLDAKERAICDPSIEQSLAILDGRTPSTLRGAAQAARHVAAFVLFGLACRAWLGMSW